MSEKARKRLKNGHSFHNSKSINLSHQNHTRSTRTAYTQPVPNPNDYAVPHRGANHFSTEPPQHWTRTRFSIFPGSREFSDILPKTPIIIGCFAYRATGYAFCRPQWSLSRTIPLHKKGRATSSFWELIQQRWRQKNATQNPKASTGYAKTEHCSTP